MLALEFYWYSVLRIRYLVKRYSLYIASEAN